MNDSFSTTKVVLLIQTVLLFIAPCYSFLTAARLVLTPNSSSSLSQLTKLSASTVGNTASNNNDSNTSSWDGTRTIKVGFIGCGTIAVAIATSLATIPKTTDDEIVKIDSIAVTRRSKRNSKALTERFPSLVKAYDDNQKVVDQSDIIFVCVLPEQTSEVLRDLSFNNSKHTLVSLVSTAKLEDLAKDSKLDSGNVSKMICLPSVARHQGVCLHCCPKDNPLLKSLFQSMSGVTTLRTEKELEACMTTTCIMGPLYGTLKNSRDWLLSNTGLSKQEASDLIIQQYVGAIQEALRDEDKQNPDLLDNLIEEQTPGGLNEQALKNFAMLNGLNAQTKVADAIVSRIRGDSDGSID